MQFLCELIDFIDSCTNSSSAENTTVLYILENGHTTLEYIKKVRLEVTSSRVDHLTQMKMI